MKSRATKLAALSAVMVFVLLLVVFRMRNYVPFAAALASFVIVWLAMLPAGMGRRKLRIRAKTPEGQAVAQLDAAAAELQDLSRKAPMPDRPLFARMAELMGRIRDHHIQNPDHTRGTDKFRKHVIGRMVTSIADYVRLAAQSGPDQKDRLAAISTQLEEFVPVLEKIDRACLENDITALEINVEVLNEQLDRRRH
jgi:hypothetical protein